MSSGEHILQDFELEMQTFRGSVLAMANRAREFVRISVTGLIDRDLERLESLQSYEDDLDDYQRRIDRAGRVILLRFHPVGIDLRQVVAGMKISIDLERLGDHAENIGIRSRRMIKANQWGYGDIVDPLYRKVIDSLTKCVKAYTENDAGLAMRVVEGDEEIDALYAKLYAATLSRMKEHEDDAEELLDVIFIMTSLERIGDYAVNIAESSYYIVKSNDLRHT